MTLNLLHCSSVIPPSGWLLLHLKQKQMSKTKLQLVSHVFCPFSGLFPHFFWSVFGWTSPTQLNLHICITHMHPASLFPMGFSQCVWCRKFSWMFSDALLQSWRKMERKNKSYCENGFLRNLHLHERKWDLFSLRISLCLWITSSLSTSWQMKISHILCKFICFLLPSDSKQK